jgi:FkbM family methyltransferase
LIRSLRGPTLKRWLETQAVRLFGLVFRRLPRAWKTGVKQRVFDRHLAWRDVTVEATTIFGSKLSIKFPDAIQTTIFLTGVWEPHITALVSAALALGDVFVDVGANVGYYSLLASRLVGDVGKVFAFEASPSIYAMLAGNMDRNRRTNVVTVNRAVSDKVGTCEIFLGQDTNIGHSTIVARVAETEGHRSEAVVECGPLPVLMPIDDLLRARLVKIDIEGAERHAIEGIVGLLPRFSDQTEWLVELSPAFSPSGQADVDWIFKTFVSAGYRAYVVANEYSDAFIFSDATSTNPSRISAAPESALSDVLFSKIR